LSISDLAFAFFSIVYSSFVPHNIRVLFVNLLILLNIYVKKKGLLS